MNFMKSSFMVVLVLGIAYLLFYFSGQLISKQTIYDNYRFKISSLDQVQPLFPQSIDQINKQKNRVFENSKKSIQDIVSIKNTERSFGNTVLSIDRVLNDFICLESILYTIANVHTDKALREVALSSCVEIGTCKLHTVLANRELYNAFDFYVANNSEHENLDSAQIYFITHIADLFKRNGLGLSNESLAKLKDINKEILALSVEFQKNINQDNRFILAEEKELTGLEKDFIANLKRNKEGLCIVGIDGPTYFTVLKSCSNSEIRKRLYKEYINRGYPGNDSVLKDIIKKRDTLAKMLGYTSYSDFDCANQMSGSQERAENFITDLFEYASKKSKKELELFLTALKDEIALTKDGKICPWDIYYVVSNYKKKCFDIDESKIAEYFPMEKTVDALINICKRFFNLDIREVSNKGLWHKDLSVLEISSAEKNNVLGYLIMDLYPRENKFPHACAIPIFPAIIDDAGKNGAAVVSVVANFPKSTPDKPSLLKLDNIRTFFHEAGHALHSILGSTQIFSLSGINTKTDFVEVPSQLMELFIEEPEVLKMLSSHYKTGESLPDELIQKIISVKNLNYGHYVQAQLYYAMISLELFKDGEDKEPRDIIKRLGEYMLKDIQYVDFNNMHATFIHLTEYGAKYYSYIWSRVLALDLYDYIKKNGFLDPNVGQRYIDQILSRGGCVDPNILMKNFLARETNNKAFIKHYGFA